MVTERVTIVVDAKGTRVVIRDLRNIGGTAEKSAAGVSVLKRAMLALGGTLILRSLVRVADSYNLIQNRLRVVTDGTEELVRTQAELFRIANQSRSAIEGVAQIYARFALATRDTNIEQRELLNLTENVTKAAIIGGAAQAEARAGLIQLSQALASNRLSGDELRSVLEQLPVVAQKIAQELGTSVGALRKLGEQGLITRDVIIGAFGEVDEELQEQFAKTVPTIAQSFTVLGNRITASVGKFNEVTGASAKFSKILITVGENLDVVVLGMATLIGAVLILVSGKILAKLITQFKVLTAFKFVGVAGGLTAIFLAAVKLRDTSKTLAENLFELTESFDELINERALQVLADAREDQEFLTRAIASSDSQAKAFTASLQDQINVLRGANVELKRRGAVLGGIENIMAQFGLTVFKATEADKERARALGVTLIAEKRRQKVLQEQIKILKKARIGDEAASVQLQALTELHKEGRISAELYAAGLKKLRKSSVDPLVIAQEELNLALETNVQVTQSAADILREIKGPQIEYQNNLKAINELLKIGEISLEEADAKRKKLADDEAKRTSVGKASPLTAFLRDINDQAAQTEQVLVNTFQSAEDALVDFVQTGKFNFKGLVDSILADLTRLLARQALLGLLNALGGQGGALGGAVAAGLSGARQGGGPVGAGRSFLVGEGGPEVFTPNTPGQITPGAGASVTVINVMDPGEVTAALETPEGEQVILNVIGRNRQAVRRQIS